MSDLAHPARGRPDPGAAGALLGRLFEQHGRTVYGLCRLLLRDVSEAEDAAQQTFLSAYRALRSGVVPRDGGAWLSTIARNECRSRARARMREPLALEPGLMAAGESLDDTAARSEQVRELKAALLDLPHKQREAVLLRDVYGLGYGEIASALGATRPAVEALLFRARRRLQGRLRPLRDAAAALMVPPPLRDALAEAIPGFTTGGGVAGAAAGVTAAKLMSPFAAKLAAATLMVGTAGTTVAVVGSERSHHAPRRTAAAAAETAATVPDPPRPAVLAAVPASINVDPQQEQRRSSKAKPPAGADDSEDATANNTNDENDNNDEQDGEHGRSSSPAPATTPSVSTHEQDGEHEHAVRSAPSDEGGDSHHGQSHDEGDSGGGGGGGD